MTEYKRVKCIYCGKEMKAEDFAGINNKGMFCNSFFCLNKLLMENEK